MAIYYVNKTGDDDTAQPDNKSLPYQHIQNASDAARLATGDNIVEIADGTYVGTEVGSLSYWKFAGNPAATSVTCRAENAGQVRVIAGVTTGVLNFGSGTGTDGKIYTFEDLILGRESSTDAGVDATYCVGGTTMPTTDPLIVNLTRCTFYNALTYTMQFNTADALIDLTVTDCISESSHVNTKRSLSADRVGATASLSIDGLTLNHSNWNNTQHALIKWDAAQLGATYSIKNVSGTIDIDANASAGIVYAIWAVDCDDSVVDGVNLTITNQSASAWQVKGIIAFCNDANLSAANQKINDAHLTLVNMSGGGYAIGIDADVSTAINNKSDGSKITNSSVIADASFAAANGHGIGVTSNSSCEISGCYSSFCDIGILLKGTVDSVATGNLVDACGLNGTSKAALYSKGGTDDFFCNNTIIIDANSDCDGLFLGDNSGTDSTNITVKNNYFAVLANTARKIINSVANQTATFDNNAYTTIGTIPNLAFTYGGFDYATVADWLVNEPNGINLGAVDPMVDSASGNYLPKQGSALIGAGTNWWTGVNPVGYGGEPYADLQTDIGYVQSIYSGNHPARLGSVQSNAITDPDTGLYITDPETFEYITG